VERIKMRKVTVKKLTLKALKEVVRFRGFKIVYNLEDKEFDLVDEYKYLYKYERLIR
jgi:hypothetical protein